LDANPQDWFVPRLLRMENESAMRPAGSKNFERRSKASVAAVSHFP